MDVSQEEIWSHSESVETVKVCAAHESETLAHVQQLDLPLYLYNCWKVWKWEYPIHLRSCRCRVATDLKANVNFIELMDQLKAARMISLILVIPQCCCKEVQRKMQSISFAIIVRMFDMKRSQCLVSSEVEREMWRYDFGTRQSLIGQYC